MKKLKVPEGYNNPPKSILEEILVIYYLIKENKTWDKQIIRQNMELTHGLLIQVWQSVSDWSIIISTVQSAEVDSYILQMHFIRQTPLICVGSAGTRLPLMTVRYLLCFEI